MFDNIEIIVSDQAGISDSLATFNITVIELNDSPVIGGESSISVNEDSTLNFSPTVTDEEGDTVTISVNNLPAWATYATSNNVISGTPTNDDVSIFENIENCSI